MPKSYYWTVKEKLDYKHRNAGNIESRDERSKLGKERSFASLGCCAQVDQDH